MKTILSTLMMGALMFMVSGCKSVPTPESMSVISTSIGVSTGMVCNMTSIDDVTRNTIVDIVNEVKAVTPAPGVTFEKAWTPIAQAHTDKLVQDGKIDAGQAVLIMSAFSTVTKGIDYLFDVRFPKAGEYKDLTEAAVNGFCTGFLTIFKPVNSVMAASVEAPQYDEKAFKYLFSATRK